MIKDRMDFMLKRGTLKVSHDVNENMLEIERQKAEIEHRKLQIEAQKLNLEKIKLEKKLQTETAKPVSKPNTVKYRSSTSKNSVESCCCGPEEC